MLKLPAIRAHAPSYDDTPTLDADADADLVAAALADRRAFAPLYRRHVDPIYRYCHRRLDSREAAEDAVSLVFTRALAALPTYRPAAGSFRAWLFAIAHNAVIDALRAQRPAAPFDAALDAPDPAPTPEDLALAADARRSLRALLAELSLDQRHVVELHLAGLTAPEIAAILGRSPDAVRALQSRAVVRLRVLLTTDSPQEHHHGDA